MSIPSINAFVVEDNPLHQLHIQLALDELGYELAGMTDQTEGALAEINGIDPDFVVLDISLKGEQDGIWLAEQINQAQPRPVIFVTSHEEPEFFARARDTRPYAYLIKPVSTRNLQRSVELAMQHFRPDKLLPAVTQDFETGACYNDAFFVKVGHRLVKVGITSVDCIESAGNRYAALVLPEKTYNIRASLTELEVRLAPFGFLRVHRSYLINTTSIQAIHESDQTVQVGTRWLPIGNAYKESLYRHIRRL